MRAYAFQAAGSHLNSHTQGDKMRKFIKTVAVLGFVAVTANSWAVSASIQGVVKDGSGKPINGADVKIWPRYAGTWTKFVKTDANGHYSYDGVAPGVKYVVTVLIHSKIEASNPDVMAKSGTPTEVNFDLKKATAPAPNGTKKVVTKQGSGNTGRN